MEQEALRRAARLLREARKAIVLTGAGASTDSGIPDFRSEEGLWSRYDPAAYATLGAFKADPGRVWYMLHELDSVLNVPPNAGHVALAELEAGGAIAGIVTQNVDGLHQAAGSHNVVEFHGSGRTLTCLACRRRFSREAARDMPRRAGGAMPYPPGCDRTTPEGFGDCLLKPDVVFFDEAIPPLAQLGAEELVAGADLVLVAGTACEVYPAAALPERVLGQGGRVVEVNREPVADLAAEVRLTGRFAEVMPALVQAWRALEA